MIPFGQNDDNCDASGGYVGGWGSRPWFNRVTVRHSVNTRGLEFLLKLWSGLAMNVHFQGGG